MNHTDTLITEDDIVNWILARYQKGLAFKDWPEDVIRTFIHRIMEESLENIKMITAIENGKITGILVAKLFWDENRCHISQLMADNKGTFSFLLKWIYEDYNEMCFSYERRKKAHVCYRTKRFKQLIESK
jgi:hypothetical protein